MLDWFSILSNSNDFSPEHSSYSVQECPPKPTVSITGREKEFYDEAVSAKAFGRPWAQNGTYAWEVVSGTCRLSPKSGSRIDVRRTSPGTVRLGVTYTIGNRSSEKAFLTIKFIAYPIYIVGGGAAGLKAADHLLTNGYKVVLCEATGRLGGRARTEDALNGNFKVDLGCQWLHKDEWRRELELKNANQVVIPNAGFRIDDQRSVHLQLATLWNWAQDAEAVRDAAHDYVDAALTGGYDNLAASTHADTFANENFPDATATQVYADRRGDEVNAGLDLIVQNAHNQNVLTATNTLPQLQITQEATRLARAAYVGTVQRGDFASQAANNVLDTTNRRRGLVNREQMRLHKAARTQAGQNFDNDVNGNQDQLIQNQRQTAEQQLIAAEVTRLETMLRNQSRAGLVNQFDQGRGQAFDDLCEYAYELERAKVGPLEEAAEWANFSNFDLDGHNSLGPQNGPNQNFNQSDDNAWYLGGYGNLIAAYGAYLERTHGAKLWIRKNCSVTGITHRNAEATLTLQEGNYNSTAVASAVIVTVSTGVINAGNLRFHGAGSNAVTNACARIPMGNYKKVVFVFDRDVLPNAAVGAAGNAGTHCGSSVYWYLGANNTELWKFIVPDVNRSIVITIVGGDLATRLDYSKAYARAQTVVALRAAGITGVNHVEQEHFVSTWMTEPQFLGAYSYTAVNGNGAREILIAQPLANHGVYIAGEALFREYGTAHGAYITGLRAAVALHAAQPRQVFDTAANMD